MGLETFDVFPEREKPSKHIIASHSIQQVSQLRAYLFDAPWDDVPW